MTRSPRARKTLFRFGRHGRSVRVFVERGGELVRVQWRQRGALRTQSWPNTGAARAEARAFAETIAEELAGPEARRGRESVTVRQLFERYLEAEGRSLRPATIRNRRADWRRWELFVGRGAIADELGPDRLAQLVAALDRQGLAARTIGEVVNTVKLIYNWGEEQEVLRRDRLVKYKYKVGKDRRPESPAEFSAEEFQQLLGVLRPDAAAGWRAWAVLALCGYQGARQWAVLHLQWADLDLEAGVVTWRAAWDKQGREWRQPIREVTRAVLERVRRWHEASGLTSPWLFPAHHARAKSEVYTRDALCKALHAAEARAGIPHRVHRGAHGLRRMLAGDVLAATGNPKLAMEAIGDRDLKTMERYLKRREGALSEAFRRLDEPAAASSRPPENRSETVTEGE
jgi:integrase